MITHKPTFRGLLLPGGFALLCMLLLLISWKTFGGHLPLQARDYRVHASLPSSNNLWPGSDVRTAGISIGRVTDVHLANGRAQVTMAIKDDAAPLHQGTRLILRTKTLLGESYLQLSPGRPAGPLIPDGGRIPTNDVEPTQRLDDVLSALDPTTRARLRGMIGGLGRALHGRGGDLNDGLGHAAPAVDSLATVAAVLDHDSPELQQLIASSGDVFNTLGDRHTSLRQAIAAGDAVFATTARRDTALERTVRALPGFLGTLRRTSVTLGAVGDELQTAVRSLQPTVPRIAPALRAIEHAAPTYRAAFRGLPGVLKTGTRSLPSVRTILGAAGAATPPLRGVERDLLPFLQLAAASRDSIVGSTANVASVMAGQYAASDGTLANTVSAIPTFWNESLAGWVQRLPSNRQNPYPKPGSAADIANGGLKAFDCRNIHNKLAVPPLGGSPPCRVQGPWEFNGKTRYFPQLAPAP